MNNSTQQQVNRFPKFKMSFLALSLCSLITSGCISTGTGGTAISGSAGGSESLDANTTLEHCDQTLGTLAIDDGRNATWYHAFYRATNVTTIEPLIRLAVQQSNCFVITSIGNIRSDDRLRRITDLQRNSGEYRAGSKQQKGQRVAADYYLEPAIVIDNSSIGGVAGTAAALLGNRFGSFGNSIATIGGGFDAKSSVVSLTLFDIRSALQIAISEGSSTASNYGAALGYFSSDVSTALKGYSNTPEGKATVAAFLDSYNGLVRSLRNYKAQNVKGGLGRGGSLKVN